MLDKFIFIYVIISALARNSSFIFFSVGISRWQKINVLFARWLF
jgi:hypothetical protein